MASYVVPQVEIHQLFSEIPVALTQNQVPFVFGPNYLLHRYGVESEKVGTYVGEYDAAEQTAQTKYFFAYPNVLDTEKIDTTYTKLFADNCIVELTSIANATLVTGKPDELNIPVSGTSPNLALEITAGRRLRITCSNNTVFDVTVVKVDQDASTVSNLVVVIDEEITLGESVTISSVTLCEVQQGAQIIREDLTDAQKQNFNWTEAVKNSVDGIEIQRQFKVKINDPDFIKAGITYGTVLYADVYLEFRELIDSAADAIHTLTLASEVSNALGAVSPDNPLAQGVYNAALNAGGQTVRYMAVPTNDEEGYNKVLNAATLTKEVYFMVPITQDSKILDLVQSHVNDMSAPTVKRWRIAFVSAEVPDVDPIYTAEAKTSGRDFQAEVIAVDSTNKTADVQYVVQSGAEWIEDKDTTFKKDVVKDDILVLKFSNQEWGKVVPKEYRIVKVLSNSKVRVSDPKGTLSTTSAGEKSEIYHPYTNTQKAEAIRDISSNFSDRRMYNVFPTVFKGGGVQQTGEFAAACVAGLVSSCLPQQPVTNLELVGIDDIPLTYQTFSTYDLNVMASGGTFIVTQDLPNDQVYVRHQISTDYEENNLNTAELSVTKNLDSISFYFDDLLSPYIGKYNITPELLSVLRNVITEGLVSLESTAWGLYGPQIIAEGTEILLLEQDAVLKDHVNCNIKLNLPYPFNHLVLKLFV